MVTVRYIDEVLRKTKSILNDFQPSIDYCERINEKVTRDLARYKPFIAEFTRVFDQIQQFRRDNEILTALYRDEIRVYLVQRGWYVGSSLSARQTQKLARAIKDGFFEQIEAFMTAHVRSRLNVIEQDVLKQWPERRECLADAFQAHRSGKFTLSVPVMLAQADGMAFEILNACVFTGCYGKLSQKARAFIETELRDQPLMSAYVGILLEDSGLRIRTAERDQRRSLGQPISPLNRHGVLHGIDSDYPTEPNGLRAVSLIDLLTDVSKLKKRNEKLSVEPLKPKPSP